MPRSYIQLLSVNELRLAFKPEEVEGIPNLNGESRVEITKDNVRLVDTNGVVYSTSLQVFLKETCELLGIRFQITF